MSKSVLTAPHFHDEAAALAYVEGRLWPMGPTCPHCGNADTSKIGTLKGKSTRPGVRKCYECRKPFSVKVGTIFESSHVPLHLWLQAIHLLCASKKGMSSNQLHRTLGITLKSAWFLSHRIRLALTSKPTGQLGGEVRSFHVDHSTMKDIVPVVLAHVDPKSTLNTDEARLYTRVGKTFAAHQTVNHKAKEYVRGTAYTNALEGFFSVFKRGMKGVYQHCGEQHLHRYLAEFDLRYNARVKLGVDDAMRAGKALKGVVGKRLTYQTTRGA